MTKPQPIPPGHEHIIPHLVCSPCLEAIDFYQRAFGAVEIHHLCEPGGKRVMHAALQVGTSLLFLNDDFPEACGGKSQTPAALQGTPVTLHHYVVDCDAAIERAVKAGATVLMPASDMFWGDRYGVVVDPFGHRWSFATHQRDLSPQQLQAAMNEACAQAPAASGS